MVQPQKAETQQQHPYLQQVRNAYDSRQSLGASRQSITGSYITDDQNELTDSIPAFIIKPFEESAENVEADGQTAVKAFEDGFDFGDDEWAEPGPDHYRKGPVAINHISRDWKNEQMRKHNLSQPPQLEVKMNQEVSH